MRATRSGHVLARSRKKPAAKRPVDAHPEPRPAVRGRPAARQLVKAKLQDLKQLAGEVDQEYSEELGANTSSGLKGPEGDRRLVERIPARGPQDSFLAGTVTLKRTDTRAEVQSGR